MRGCIGCFMYLFITFPIMFGVLFGVAVIQWAFDRDFYADVMTDDALFDALYSAEMPNYFSGEVFGSDEALAQSGTALALALREVIPQEYLETEVRRLIDETFDFIEGQQGMLYLTVDARIIKDNFRGEPGLEFAQVMAENLPVCTADIEATYGDTALIACIPEEISREQAEGLIVDVIPTVLQDIPDTIELMEEPAVREDNVSFDFADTIAGLTVALLCAGAFFWFLNSLLGGGGSRRGLFIWLGVLLLLPTFGILSMGFGTRSGVVRSTVSESLAQADFGDLDGSDELRLALTDTAVSAASMVSGRFMIVGGLGVAAAFLLLILGMSSRPKGGPYADGPIPVGIPPQEYRPKPKNTDDDDPIHFDF